MDTVKDLGLWSGQGKLSSQDYYVFSPLNQPVVKLSPCGYYVVYLVDKPSIHEIWSVKLILTLRININQSQTKGTLTNVFVPLVQIWWS